MCSKYTCSTVWSILILILNLALALAKLVIVSEFMQDCPVEKYIPIYLVVSGCALLVLFVTQICTFTIDKWSGGQLTESGFCAACLICFNVPMYLFLFAWEIAGSVWVYRTYSDWSREEGATNYCHPTLYLFAFGLLTASYVYYGLYCVVKCCVRCTSE